jgi:AraC family transcriptional regulator
MHREQTLNRWVERLEGAARLLAERLDDPPSLAELAAAACVSPFHFHRIWRALTRETVTQSVTRLRLDAAKLLLANAATVTDAAMSSGYGTPQSFARAFRRRTGQSPSAWRIDPIAPARDEFAIEIVQRDSVLVVALRCEGRPYRELNSVFGAIWSWADATCRLDKLAGIYGLPLDDPESVAVPLLRYDAALALGPAEPPEPFKLAQLPGGRFAKLRHRGSYEGLEPATQHLVGSWLPRSHEEPADASVIHHFLNDPDETSEADLLTDILLPLKPRPAQ